MIRKAVSKGANLTKFRSSLPKGGMINSSLMRTMPNVSRIHPMQPKNLGRFKNALGSRIAK